MTEKELTRRWAQAWMDTGSELEKIRLREARDKDIALSLRLLARAFNCPTNNQPPGESSGLVEMQRHQGWRSCFIGGIAALRWSQPFSEAHIIAVAPTFSDFSKRSCATM
jgi:hypothetical protein